jgi:surfactin synthase thioesterase subunit
MGKKPDWLFPLRKAASNPSARLLVFPYAAAGASALRPLMTRLPESVELLGVALPGRERRFGEPPATSHVEIVQAVAGELAAREPLPAYLFGHSMGASLALALALMEPELCQGVVVSGRKPTGVTMSSVLGMADDEIVSFLGAVGNTAPQLLKDIFWQDRLIQLFRSDTALNVQTSQAIESGLVSQHLIVLGGTDDPYVDPRGLDAWAQRTSGGCDVMVFPGNHFFLLDPSNLPAIASVLGSGICGLAEPSGR